MLLIIASTGDMVYRAINIDDIERTSTRKIRGFGEFFAIFCCDTRFKSELRQNGWR